MSRHDQLHRYLFNHHSVRGELVLVSETLQHIFARHYYPQPVERLLAEMLVATSLLTATLKFNGDIAMQLQGDGPHSLAVINGNSLQEMRGVARINGDIADNATLQDMVGNGVMAITITPTEGERYQSMIPLEGENISQLLENYFHQSEQLPTRFFIHCHHQQEQWQAGGMLLQVLPVAGAMPEAFDHLSTLTETLTDLELFKLTPHEVLFRLYHQEEVTLLGSQPISFHCHCSRERTARALLSMAREEVEQILQQEGQINMQCDYCGTHYLFSPPDILGLYQQETQ